MEDQELKDVVVRVAIEGGGCSGFQYNLSFSDLDKYDQDKDLMMEQDGIKIVVDKKSDLYLDGTILDWHEDLTTRGFKFDNPNATKSCGCGSSFQA